MKISDHDFLELRRNEEDMLRPEVRFSREKMHALLDNEFLEFGASGKIYSKEQTIDVQPQEIGAQLPLPDFSARLLAPTVALVTYRSIQMFSDGTVKEARRSSIWRKSEKGWRIVFHQGTLLHPTS